ncbi:MAG: diguanylate cyclase [Pelomonas sp.]|nr:diguanylate cyclase [Roseateles sp.]
MKFAHRLAWLLGLCCAAALAEPPPVAAPLASWVDAPTHALTQYKIDTWQTEQGLPLNTVQALVQTRDGHLWVGTAGGLARFDGERFTTFSETEAPGMGDQPVFGLMEDSQGRLWIGHSKGAAVYRNGRFETAIPPAATGGRRVWSFAEGRDGAVWAATENGLVRWTRATGATKVYREADGLPTNRLRALAFDRDGRLWIATTGGGLSMFADGKFTNYQPDNGFPGLQVRALLADPQGGVWATTDGAGLVHAEPGRFKAYREADGLPTEHLTALARDVRGDLWIGSWGSGVVRYSGGRFDTLGEADGVAGGQIWALRADREGSVWVGTWFGGLNRLRNRSFVAFGAAEGLSHDNVRAVLPGRGGAMWVSTAGGGLDRIVGDHIDAIGVKQGLPTEQVSSLAEDADGTLWIGTYTSGVVRYAQGRAETFGVAQGLPGTEVRAVLRDRAGRLWVGTRAGLARFNGHGFDAVTDPQLPAEGVVTILEDRRGTLWFGTAGQGLVQYRDGRFRAYTTRDGMVSNWILALYEDADGNLWVGTNGEGMNRLRDGQVAAIRTRDGLWDGISQTILEDRAGNLWMSCNRGFYSVPRAELAAFADGRIAAVHSAGFGPGDALRSTTFAGGHLHAGAIDAGGHLWLPSARGLVIVDPQRLPGLGAAPAVALEAALVDGKPADLAGPVALPPGPVPLDIRFAASTLLYADRARFRYRMAGLSQDWVDAGSSRAAVFPALPHGRYRFEVVASIDGVHWSAAPAVLPITVAAYFYQTGWFVALAVIAGAAALAGLFQLRVRRLRARQAEMERLVAQRTEELREANEHLARLSFVDALTGLANRRRFDEAVAAEWRRARRNRTSLALVIADIDGFKRYNDLLGHLDGDRCLSAVAGVFARAAGRAGDLAARYGGEEFVVLLPGADAAAARAVAEQLRGACEALAIPHPDAPAGGVVTISLGVAACRPGEHQDVEALIAAADAALYRAKQDGRNRVA